MMHRAQRALDLALLFAMGGPFVRYSEPAALPWAGSRSAVAAPRVRAPGRRSAPATPPSGARCSSWSVLCLTSPLNSVRRAAGRGGLPRGRTPTSVSPQSPPRTPALCGTLPALDAPLGHAGQHPRTDLVSRGACQPHPKGLLQAEGPSPTGCCWFLAQPHALGLCSHGSLSPAPQELHSQLSSLLWQHMLIILI